MKKERMVVLDLSNNLFKNPYLNQITKVLLGVTVFYLVLINANVVTYASKFDILIFAMAHIAIEMILVRFMYRYLTKYIVLSFGLILILPITIAATMAYMLVQPLVMFPSTDALLGFVVLFMTSRKILTVLLQGYLKRRKYEKLIRERVKNDV